MNRNSSRLYWTLGGIIALAVMVTSALLLAESVLNRPATARQISALATRHIGGPVHFSAVRLSLFLTPHVTLEDLRGYLPGKIGVTARKVSVYLSLNALLGGNLPIGAVRVEAPEIFAALPSPGRTGSADETDIAALVSGAVGALAGRLPYLKVAVDNGRVSITGDAFAGMTLENVRARLSIPDGRLTAACSSAAWKRLEAALDLDAESQGISGQGRLIGVNLAALGAMFPGALPVDAGETDASLEIQFKGRGARIVSATAALEVPALDMPLPGGALSLGGIRIAGDYADGPDTRTIRLTTLRLARPQIDARASVITTKKPTAETPRYRITAAVDTADLGGIRSALDAAMGRQPTVATVLGIVRGGHAADIAFTVSGDTPGALGAFEKMTISGRVEDAEIRVPGVELALTDAASRVLIQNGVLHCEAASARTGQSRGSNGRLELGLTAGNDLLTLDVDVSADLADLPPVLSRILKEKNRQWLDALSGISGKAAGTLKLGERLSDLRVSVDISDIEGGASLRGLPQRVDVLKGRARITEKSLALIDASAAMGGSAVTGLSVTLSFADPVAEIRAVRISLDSAEIYSWLVQKPESAALQGVVGAATGTVTLEGLDWKGAFDRPWDGLRSLSVRTNALTLTGGALPDAVTLSCRKLHLYPDKATFAEARLRMSDAILVFSGDLVAGSDGLASADFKITGDLGDAVFRRLADNGRLPPQLIINPPLRVSDLHVGWRRAKHVTLVGDLRMGSGPQISIDAALAQEDVNVRSLRIRDSASDCSFRFRYHKMQVEAGFTGRLSRSTVDRLLAENTVLMGAIEGNAALMLPLENPAGFEMDGYLKADGLHLPDWMGDPLLVGRLDVRAEGRQVFINSIDMNLLRTHLKAAGRAAIDAETLEMGLTVSADRVDIPRWTAARDAFSDKAPAAQPAGARQTPKRRVRAMLSLSIAEVVSGRFKWAPVDAAVTLTPGKLSILFSSARICGISHPGSVTLTPEGISADMALSATGQNLNTTLNCLHDRPVDLTGTFDLSGTLTANGPLDSISKLLAGNIHMQTSSGQIYHVESLENIFSLLDLPGLLESGVRNQKKQGLPYDTIAADIKIGNGVVTLERGAMVGPMMQLAFQGDIGIEDQALDVTVFVVPLKSIASVASRIPFIGRIISGDLISIPVKISGTMKAPLYLPLAPDAVGQKAVRILKDIIQLPIDIIQPIVPTGGRNTAPPPGDRSR